MDEEAFAPGASEVELENHTSVLLGRGGLPKMGRAILTNDRVLFFDQKYDPGASGVMGGVLAEAIAHKLQKRHEAGGPLMDLPLTEVTRVSRAKKLFNKDIIVLEAGSAEHRLNDGFKTWDPLLRRLLAERHGRRIVQDGPDTWRAET